MFKRLAAILICMFCLSLGLSGCNSNKSGKETSLRVGFFPNITHAQALMGKEDKFQSATGCSIDWKQFNAGSTEIEAMLAGELDMAYIGPGPAVNGFIKSNGGLQVISGVSEAGAVIVSRSDVIIKDIKELSGKKIAVPQFGNTQHVVLKQLLDSNGLKENTKGGDVEVVQADNPDIKTLFDNKSIDAAFVPEPWASRLIEESKANIVLDYNQVWRDGKYPVAVLIARTDFIKEHPEVVEKFLKAHIELTNEINNNKSEAKETINKQLEALTGKKLSDSIIDSSFNRMIITDEVDKEAVLDMADFMEKLGVIKSKENIDKIFNFEILNKIK